MLTKFSQAGESCSLQDRVVGKTLTGSQGDSLDAVPYQDVVETLCKKMKEKNKTKNIRVRQKLLFMLSALKSTLAYQSGSNSSSSVLISLTSNVIFICQYVSRYCSYLLTRNLNDCFTLVSF